MFGMIFALLSTFQIQTPVAADSVEQSINVGGSPNTIAITPDGSKIIVMDGADDEGKNDGNKLGIQTKLSIGQPGDKFDRVQILDIRLRGR